MRQPRKPTSWRRNCRWQGRPRQNRGCLLPAPHSRFRQSCSSSAPAGEPGFRRMPQRRLSWLSDRGVTAAPSEPPRRKPLLATRHHFAVVGLTIAAPVPSRKLNFSCWWSRFSPSSRSSRRFRSDISLKRMLHSSLGRFQSPLQFSDLTAPSVRPSRRLGLQRRASCDAHSRDSLRTVAKAPPTSHRPEPGTDP